MPLNLRDLWRGDSAVRRLIDRHQGQPVPVNAQRRQHNDELGRNDPAFRDAARRLREQHGREPLSSEVRALLDRDRRERENAPTSITALRDAIDPHLARVLELRAEILEELAQADAKHAAWLEQLDADDRARVAPYHLIAGLVERAIATTPARAVGIVARLRAGVFRRTDTLQAAFRRGVIGGLLEAEHDVTSDRAIAEARAELECMARHRTDRDAEFAIRGQARGSRT